jgi:hypothetical protein
MSDSEIDHILVAIRGCCFHETAQNLERSEIARMIRVLAKTMQPDYEKFSATLDPCLWLYLLADNIELRP